MAERRFLEKYNGFKLGWLHDSIFFFAAAAVLFVLFRFIIGLSVVSGSSMEPSLHDGDIVLYFRASHRIEAGDIVSVRIPSGDYYIKRVAAGGGCEIDIADGHLIVDGSEDGSPQATGVTEEQTGAVIYPYLVSGNSYFLLGDNRETSVDSRSFGEVSRRQILGRVLFSIGKSGIHPAR